MHAKVLAGKRMLISGKGGRSKSALVASMALVLTRRGYDVLALDGDASNPEGLARKVARLTPMVCIKG